MILSIFIFLSFLIAAVFILSNKWHKSEPQLSLIVMGSSLLLSLLIFGVIHLANSERTMFNEVWNYKIIKVEYFEEWDEEVPCSHPIYITVTHTSTDSEGNTTTYTEQVYVGNEHLYDVSFNPAKWCAVDEYGDSHGIGAAEYKKWKSIWNNETFQDLNRSYHSIDGDMYYSCWNQEFNTIYPWEEIKSYQNKIRVSKSVFNFAEVSKEISLRYKRPADKNNGTPILTYGIQTTAEDDLLFRRVNASLGKQYRIHNIIMLFDATLYPTSEIENIKNAWQGANKNELVTCIAMYPEDNTILWCDVFSWMDDTTIHSLIRQDVIEMKTYNKDKLSQIIQTRVSTNWKKKDFRDFDYIKVDVPVVYNIVGLVMVFILNIVMVILFQYNYTHKDDCTFKY